MQLTLAPSIIASRHTGTDLVDVVEICELFRRPHSEVAKPQIELSEADCGNAKRLQELLPAELGQANFSREQVKRFTDMSVEFSQSSFR